jgi:Sec23/Sec24 trunk domain
MAMEFAEYQVRKEQSCFSPSETTVIGSVYPEKTCIFFLNLQVCVDVFLTTQTYVDIASISVVPRTTGGQVNKIINLVAPIVLFRKLTFC